MAHHQQLSLGADLHCGHWSDGESGRVAKAVGGMLLQDVILPACSVEQHSIHESVIVRLLSFIFCLPHLLPARLPPT
jgi:hypothetical protein